LPYREIGEFQMLTPYAQIEEDVRAEWSYFESDFERAVQEMADNVVPIYTGDIIKEWSHLTTDDSDRWQEFGYDGNGQTISDLMRIDLAIYYYELVNSVALSILDKKNEEAI
jgi:hypothetical protein